MHKFLSIILLYFLFILVSGCVKQPTPIELVKGMAVSEFVVFEMDVETISGRSDAGRLIPSLTGSAILAEISFTFQYGFNLSTMHIQTDHTLKKISITLPHPETLSISGVKTRRLSAGSGIFPDKTYSELTKEAEVEARKNITEWITSLNLEEDAVHEIEEEFRALINSVYKDFTLEFVYK